MGIDMDTTAETPFGDVIDAIKEDMGIATGSPLPTALIDEELAGFGVPNPRILICGCVGS